MATINDNGQSYLETQGFEARNEQLQTNNYGSGNEYNEKHEDALASSGIGKGSGDFGGHGWTVPDMTKSKYDRKSQFNTSVGGNACDTTARDRMINRSIYGPNNIYAKPDTSANIAAGQYDADKTRTRTAYICPVN